MKIEKVGIDEIKVYENNAKIHTAEQIEQIKKSIKQFGNNDPIAIDENNVIIEGNGRYLALKEMGIKEVEVIRLIHLNEEQKRAYILVHNKLTMNTEFDIDLLEEELSKISTIDMKEFELVIKETNEIINSNQEVDIMDFSDEKFKCQCPKCGFMFDINK